VLLNNRGVTLVEVIIALTVMLVVFLALMQTAIVSIDSNIKNLLRDDAVSIAETGMDEARNVPFDSLSGSTSTYDDRRARDITTRYNVTRAVTVLNADNKRVDVTVDWTWKGESYTHRDTTLIRKPL